MIKFKKKTLKNGMRIVTVPMKDNPAVTVMVMVEAGSKYESKEINGLSHFLEHMCFKGTIKRPNAIDISKELDGIGSQYNAFTSQEFTGYYAKAHAKHLSKVLDVISDMYLNPVFDTKEIEKEKGVIVEEINMYKDMPQRHIWDMFMELLYGDQPAGWNIAGTEEIVKKIKRDDFVSYRGKHYVARATTVVVSGAFDEKKIINQIEKSFAGITAGKKDKKIKVAEKQDKPNILIQFKETDQTHLILGVRSYDVFNKKLPTLKVLNAVLGGGMSSRLFQKLRDEMGVGYYVRSSADSFTDHGYLAVSTGVDNARVKEVIVAVLNELKKFKNELVPKDELKKVKDYLISGMYLGLESSDSLAEFCGDQEVLKKEILTPAQIAKKIEAVTANDIKKVANELFRDDALNLALIGKIKKSEFEDIFKF